MAKAGKSHDPKLSKDPRMDNEYMAWVDDVRQAVKTLLERGGKPPRLVATDAKVCITTLQNFVNGKTMAPRADTLFGLTRALGIPFGIPESFKRRHGIRRR